MRSGTFIALHEQAHMAVLRLLYEKEYHLRNTPKDTWGEKDFGYMIAGITARLICCPRIIACDAKWTWSLTFTEITLVR